MADKASSSHRFRMTIPTKDTTVLRWVEQQSSLSTSLRMLIRWAIQEYGYADVTCLTVRRDRGRPNQTAAVLNYEPMPETYTPDVVPASVPMMPQESVAPVYPVQQPVMQTPVQPVQDVQPVREPVVQQAVPASVETNVPVPSNERRHIPGVDDLLI